MENVITIAPVADTARTPLGEEDVDEHQLPDCAAANLHSGGPSTS